MTARSLAAAVLLCATGCSRLDDVIDGLSHFVDVGKLVDDTAFLPPEEGRRTPDSGGMTDVGAGVTAVEITFIDELDPASIAGFSVDANLEFEGVAPHPSFPPFFNVEPIGRVRPHQVLTIPLATPLPESTCTNLLPACHSTLRVFHVRLVSRTDGNPLRTIGAATPFIGTFDIPFRVIARDGARPFVSKLVTGAGTVEALTPEEVLAGAIEVGFLEPHSALRIEFSEEMREGVPVLIGPVVPVEETRTIGSRELRFFRPVTPGLSFLESVVTPPTGAPYTVLTTPAGQVHSLGQEYTVRIPSDSTLALQTTVAQDLSGEALGPYVPGLPLAAIDYTAVVHFSHVVIDVPLPNSFVSGPMLDAGPVEVLGQVRPELAGDVTVTVLDPDGGSFGPFTADPTGLVGQTPHARPTSQWRAQIPASTFEGQDGRYTIRADAVAFGSDSVTVEVDTTPPQLLGAFGSVDLYANDSDGLDRVCVAVGAGRSSIPPFGGRRNDAARAELVLPDGTVVEANSPETFEDDDGRNRFGFCWVDVDLGSNLPVGRTNLTVRLYDTAGNVGIESIEIRVHPWIDSVTPDQVPFGFFDKREIVIRGVGFKTFIQAQGDAVRIDDRDLAVPVQKDIDFGHPIVFSLRLDVPENTPPGALTVRIDGLESNRVRFDVCREEAAKYVTDLHFDDRPAPFGPGQLSFSMERGPTGEPVFVWTTTGGVARASANGGAYESSVDAAGVSQVDTGSPIQALRLLDGTVASVWLSRFRVHAAGLPGVASNFSITLPDPAIPVAVDAAVDTDGTPYALVISSIPSGIPTTVVYARLFRLDGTDATGTLVGSFASNSRTAFSGRLAFGAGGTGWVLASGSETRAWYRRGTTWTPSTQVFPDSVVADVSASRDGRGFFAALWEIAGDPDELGKEQILGNVPGRLQLLAAGRLDADWESAWTADTVFEPRAFLPPLTKRPDSYEGRFALAHAAAVRVDHENRAILAYTDFERRTLRLAHVGVRASVLDLDVTIGQQVSLTLDGNDEALVGYADLSHATTLEQVEENRKKGIRGTASIQLLDTRNRIAVIPGQTTGSSVCSPNKFVTSTISRSDWSEIRQHQRSRTKFAYRDIYEAFLGVAGQPLPSTDQERQLRAKQASAAVFSRLLRSGELRFRGQESVPGQALTGTGRTIPSAGLPFEKVLLTENRALRAPVGTVAAVSTTFTTGDPEIAEFSIAKFKPREREGCQENPDARADAAMAHDPATGSFILFGGRGTFEFEDDPNDPNDKKQDFGEDDADTGDFFFGNTWVLSSTDAGCWTRYSYSPDAMPEPSPRIGHSMMTAPGGRGILLFGGRDFTGNTLSDVWLYEPPKAVSGGRWTELTTPGGPSDRRQAALAYDPVRERVWVYGGRQGSTHFSDLWYLEITAGPTLTWTSAPSLSPPPSPRVGAGLVYDKGSSLVLFGGEAELPDFPGVFSLSNELWSYRIDPDPIQSRWDKLARNRPNSDSHQGQYLARARDGAAVVNRNGVLVVASGATRGLGVRPSVIPGEPPSIVAGNSMDLLDLEPYRDAATAPDPDNDAPAWSFEQRIRLPPARARQAWAYDSVGRKIVFFGGDALGVRLDDTVMLDLTRDPGDWEWTSLVPGDAEPIAVLAHGRDPITGEFVQWGRGDFDPLLSIEGLADALTALTPDEYPPTREGAVTVSSFFLGPVDFEDLLDFDPAAVDEQGSFESRIDFGHLEASGNARFRKQIGGEEISVTLPFDATSEIPSSTVPLPLGGTIEILRPDLCSIFLDRNDPQAYLRRLAMKSSLRLQPAIDARGPTEKELDEDDTLALQSHTKLVGVTVSGPDTLEPPICIQVGSDLFQNISSSPVGFFDSLFDRLLVDRIASRLVPFPGRESPSRGVLDEVVGAIVVDAFSNHSPDFGIDYEDRRNLDYVPATRNRCPWQDPEWVHANPDGVSLGLRWQEVRFPIPCALGP